MTPAETAYEQDKGSRVYPDDELRMEALDCALRMFESMAKSNLFKAGTVGPPNVVGAAEDFYKFLKGSA